MLVEGVKIIVLGKGCLNLGFIFLFYLKVFKFYCFEDF